MLYGRLMSMRATVVGAPHARAVNFGNVNASVAEELNTVFVYFFSTCIHTLHSYASEIA